MFERPAAEDEEPDRLDEGGRGGKGKSRKPAAATAEEDLEDMEETVFAHPSGEFQLDDGAEGIIFSDDLHPADLLHDGDPAPSGKQPRGSGAAAPELDGFFLDEGDGGGAAAEDADPNAVLARESALIAQQLERSQHVGTSATNRAIMEELEEGFLASDPFTPALGIEHPQEASGHANAAAAAAAVDPGKQMVLSTIDMLCDDLYYCKTDVLRSFARTRGVSGQGKSDVVLRLIQVAHHDAHGDHDDLTITRRVLGDVFSKEVRTSGLRTAWTNKSLEASHIEMACDRHLRFELMANTQKTLMVRRNAAEGGRVLRRLSRSFQQDYDKLSAYAVGGVFRAYKVEVDDLVKSLPVTEVVSPFASLLVAYVRYGSSMNLLTRADVNRRLQEQLQLYEPAVEEPHDLTTLQQLQSQLDEVVALVELRASCFGEKRLQWGQETADVLVTTADAFARRSHTHWSVERAPAWVTDLATMFHNWELVVRTDLPAFADAPRAFFDLILRGVVSYYTLTKLYGDSLIVPNDITPAMRASLRKALERHLSDGEKAGSMVRELVNYVQAGALGEVRGGVRSEFFVGVLSQMAGALHGRGHAPTELENERVAVVLQEVCATASRCTRSCGLQHLLVKLTEDLRFHFRFQKVFKKLSAADRKTIRTRMSLNMIKTLEYFEGEFHIHPISTKAVAFLVLQLVYLSLRPEDGRRPVLERFTNVIGREELSVVGLTETEATRVQDLRIAFPPQLSYHSWLNESDSKDKSVYNVLPSVAVKGTTNQAMIISQAPMMRALDAISRVPWRINKYMLHVQEAIVREGFGFGKIRPGFYPLHYCAMSRGDIQHPSDRRHGTLDAQLAEEEEDVTVYNLAQRRAHDLQQDADWKELSELRSSRIHYLQALRQARSLVQFSHIYFPNSMDFRGRMYPLPGRLNHTGSDPFRGILEYAEPKPLGTVGLYWLKVHLANKMGQSKLSFDERVHYVEEHIADVVQSAEAPLQGDRWWQEAAEPLQCLMACKELADALKCSQGPESFLSRVPVAVDGSYNGLQHYSAIGRDAFGATLVNLVPSERPADAYTGILKEMMKSIEADARRDHQVAQRCIGTGKGQDTNHIKRKTIKRPIMTQVYGVTGYGMSEQILDELVKQNKSHGLWTHTDMREMAGYLREKVLESLGVTFKETQTCRRWLSEMAELVWSVQPAELRNALCWTTPLGLVVRQPYVVRRECPLFTAHGYTKVPGDATAPASRKQLTALAPNLIHSLDATHLAMTALEMQRQGLRMMAVHDSYWTYACDLPQLSHILRSQFVQLYSEHDPLWELKRQWEEAYHSDLRRHGVRLPDPPARGTLDLKVVLDSPYFFS
ncbi:DNA-directed RNA polymerase, mitochondrial [Strigomonas culicis]|uniref:DNA-directed RNA polymerase n=1 Tax=Strigomonas culicis TaxID=28005 RepID=S9TPT1_9TRYP|nr:DNA-directed RNA polymerase, mitochondrial [Strigomonas culicis]|eukprot:EPY20332.1 DNA-directed RNA polymerase, mitochondrial [Strigomonas culicis]